MSFRLIPILVTLNDLERRNGPCVILPNLVIALILHYFTEFVYVVKQLLGLPRFLNLLLIFMTTLILSAQLLHRPFCERSMLCYTHVSFFPQLTFSDVCKPTFSKLFHMTWLHSKKKRCYADFVKVPLTKMRGEKPKILPNLASNRNILCAVTRNVEGK